MKLSEAKTVATKPTAPKELTKSDLTKLKGVLEGQLHELRGGMSRDLQNIESPALADINDQASYESERSFELRIKDRERKLISKVEDALRKITEGGYGTCESCGEPIGVKRLLARPVTTFCINCKTQMESEEKREESLKQHQPESSI
jgi:DnaK suppressor protein